MWKPGLAALTSLIIWLVAAAAQASPIALGVSVSPRTAPVAAKVLYTFYAEWPDGWTVTPPRLKPEQDSFDVVNCREPVYDTLASGRHRLRLTCELVIFDSGRVDLPALKTKIGGPDGLTYEDTAPDLQVEAIAPLVGDQPRPLKPPEVIRRNWAKIALVALAIAAALAALSAAIWFAMRGWKNRTPKERRAKPAVYEPPDVRALRRLGEPLLDEYAFKQDANRYYTELSDIVREYLEGRFAVPALERTSAEIGAEIAALDLRGHDGYLRDLLRVADLAKFAGIAAAYERWSTDRDSARQFVTDTRPVAVAAAVPDAEPVPPPAEEAP
jgi:hypothetical protein